MIGKLFTVAVLIAACYWYYTGPYQERVNPSYETKLKKYQEQMKECIRGLNFKAGATGEGTGNPEEECANKYNLYLKDGQWHSYEDTRQAG